MEHAQIAEALKNALCAGEDADSPQLVREAVEAGRSYPMRACSSLGIAISEDIFPLLAKYVAREREIEALETDERLPAKLDVPPGKALLHLLEAVYSAEGDALAFSHNYFLTDQFRLHIMRRVPYGGKGAQLRRGERLT